MTPSATPAVPIRTQRLIGLDVARLLALIGMVIVHARTDLVLLPLERLQPDAPSPQLPHEPVWAWWLQELFTDRARPLFFALAGIGVTLLMRKARPQVLARRAVFIAAVGVALVLIGWSDFVLVFYGIWFLMGLSLARARTWIVLIVAFAFSVLPLLPAVAATAPDGTAFNVSLILAETSYFCVGMVIGRLDLSSARWRSVLMLGGTAIFVLGLAGLEVVGDLGLDAEQSAASEVIQGAATMGLICAVIAAAITLGELAPRSRLVRWLAVAGSVPLSLYVAHALVFTGLSRTWTTTLGPATVAAIAFLLIAIVASVAWTNSGRAGPLEWLMRRASGRAERGPHPIPVRTPHKPGRPIQRPGSGRTIGRTNDRG